MNEVESPFGCGTAALSTFSLERGEIPMVHPLSLQQNLPNESARFQAPLNPETAKRTLAETEALCRTRGARLPGPSPVAHHGLPRPRFPDRAGAGSPSRESERLYRQLEQPWRDRLPD